MPLDQLAIMLTGVISAWVLWVRPCIGDMGILFNRSALWIGAHYSPDNQRWCINILPCATVWITLPGGNVPERAKL